MLKLYEPLRCVIIIYLAVFLISFVQIVHVTTLSQSNILIVSPARGFCPLSITCPLSPLFWPKETVQVTRSNIVASVLINGWQRLIITTANRLYISCGLWVFSPILLAKTNLPRQKLYRSEERRVG